MWRHAWGVWFWYEPSNQSICTQLKVLYEWHTSFHGSQGSRGSPQSLKIQWMKLNVFLLHDHMLGPQGFQWLTGVSAKLGSVASIATPGQHQWCSSLEITETEVPVSISITTFCSSISMREYLHIRDDAYQAMKSTTGHTDHHELPASSLNSQWWPASLTLELASGFTATNVGNMPKLKYCTAIFEFVTSVVTSALLGVHFAGVCPAPHTSNGLFLHIAS